MANGDTLRVAADHVSRERPTRDAVLQGTQVTSLERAKRASSSTATIARNVVAVPKHECSRTEESTLARIEPNVHKDSLGPDELNATEVAGENTARTVAVSRKRVVRPGASVVVVPIREHTEEDVLEATLDTDVVDAGMDDGGSSNPNVFVARIGAHDVSVTPISFVLLRMERKVVDDAERDIRER